MDPITVSIYDNVGVQEVFLTVAFHSHNWEFLDDRPTLFNGHNASFGSKSSSYSIDSIYHFRGMSFLGDGKYLKKMVFSVVMDSTAYPSPSTAKIYARLYSTTGTYDSSEVANAVLETSQNYYTVEELTNKMSTGTTNRQITITFTFSGTQQMTDGTCYVAGIYCSEITTNQMYISSYVAYSDTSGRFCSIKSDGTKLGDGNYSCAALVYGNTSAGVEGGVKYVSTVSRSLMGSSGAYAFYISPDGQNAYYSYRNASGPSYGLYQFKLSRPWDLSSQYYYGTGCTSTVQATSIEFSFDGRTILLATSYKIESYTLSTPFDITTASNYKFVWMGQLSYYTSERKAAFSSDGSSLFYSIEGNYSGQILKYNLATNWDISSLPGSSSAPVIKFGSLHTGSVAYLYGGSGTNEMFAQKFTPQDTFALQSLWFYGYPGQPGNLQDEVYVELVSELDGTPIATSTSSSHMSNLVTYYGTFVVFFDDPPTLVGGNTYYLQIKRTGSRSTVYYERLVYKDNSSFTTPIPGGSYWVKNSGVWTEQVDTSLCIMFFSGVARGCDQAINTTNVVNRAAVTTVSQKTSRIEAGSSTFSFYPDGSKIVIAAANYGYNGHSQFWMYNSHDAICLSILDLATPWDLSSIIESSLRQSVFCLGGEIEGTTSAQSLLHSMHITPDGKRICLANTSSNLNSDLYYLLSIDPYEINEHDTFTVQENGTQAAGIPGLFFNEDVQIEEPAPSTIFVELAAVNDSINPEDSVSIGSILVSGVVGEDISITDARGTNQINPAPIYIYRTSGGISRQKNTHTGHIIPEGLKRAPSPKDTSSQKRGGTL